MTDTAPASAPDGFQFYATTEADPWFTPDTPVTIEPMRTFPGAFLRLDAPAQEIDGFGVCFNELGWVALSRLSEAERTEVLRQIGYIESFVSEHTALLPSED